jgi:PEP-CTERM motif
MKISRICALILLLVVGTAVAFANGIQDPKVIVHGVNGGGNGKCGMHNCQNVGINFSFNIPKSGSGALFFTNASGKNWTSLTLIENAVPAADISCHQTFFLTCTAKTLKNGSVAIVMSGVRGGDNPRKGIMNGQSFAIDFACVGGNCWPKGGVPVAGHAGTGTIPEPATVALMVTGLCGLFSRRKSWRKRFSA